MDIVYTYNVPNNVLKCNNIIHFLTILSKTKIKSAYYKKQ